jgi:hypothetical protein
MIGNIFGKVHVAKRPDAILSVLASLLAAYA